jgi:DNA polymerase-4
MDRFFGCWSFSQELRNRIVKETGLPISFGMSTNKTVSKVATGEAKPAGILRVNDGDERPFLAPLSIRKIPMVGTQTFQILRNLGVRQILTLQQMPPEMMAQVLGAHGVAIWRKAQGEDATPVVEYNERKSISTERTFGKDTTDMTKLRGILTAMTENLAFQLRRGKKLTACITIKIRYADFDTRSMQARIPYTAADHKLLPKALELFDKLYDRRVRVRLIGIRLSHLVSGGCQLDLFDDTEERVSLYAAMDAIRNRFGDRSIVSAAGMEARTIGRPNPFNGEAPLLLANRHH